jgi:hypothetical protein
MRAVRVAQPVGRDRLVDASLGCRAFDHGIDVALGELAEAHPVAEHGVIVAGFAPKGEEGAADNLGQQHLAHLAALAQDR